MSRKCRRVSTRMPSVTACPLRLVPPDRNVIGTPCAAETANSRPTSAASAGCRHRAGGQREVRGVMAHGQPVGCPAAQLTDGSATAAARPPAGPAGPPATC